MDNVELTPSEEKILGSLKYEHLPVHLQQYSRPFCDLAKEMVQLLPENVFREEMLMKIWEAKNAAVMAKV
jgi:hypothetical protein